MAASGGRCRRAQPSGRTAVSWGLSFGWIDAHEVGKNLVGSQDQWGVGCGRRRAAALGRVRRHDSCRERERGRERMRERERERCHGHHLATEKLNVGSDVEEEGQSGELDGGVAVAERWRRLSSRNSGGLVCKEGREVRGSRRGMLRVDLGSKWRRSCLGGKTRGSVHDGAKQGRRPISPIVVAGRGKGAALRYWEVRERAVDASEGVDGEMRQWPACHFLIERGWAVHGRSAGMGGRLQFLTVPVGRRVQGWLGTWLGKWAT